MRDGRGQRSRTCNNTLAPRWDQEMFLAVDDLVKQSMKIRVYDEDPGPLDDLMGVAELFFTDALWPDFNAEILAEAIEDFRGRERRFGLTGKQVRQEPRS